MSKAVPLGWDIENKYYDSGKLLICGVDEAGRGPLAGPVAAAACILPRGVCIDGLNDSKKLSEKRRELLYPQITETAIAWAVAFSDAKEIDSINILEATLLAMRRAIAALAVKPDMALIDGNISRGFDIDAVSVIGGDAHSPSIAAASILAKVTRDRLCHDMDREYPQYGFAVHKGYGTSAHREALVRYGPCEYHRRTFLKFLDV